MLHFEDTPDARRFGAISTPVLTTFTPEVHEDYILPDSLPDIKKILLITCTPISVESEIREEVLPYTVDLCVELLYVSDTNRLRHVKIPLHFSGKEAIPPLEDATALLSASCIGAEVRMLSVRKVSLRVKLAISLCVFSKLDLAPDTPDCNCTLKTKEDTVSTLQYAVAADLGLPLSFDFDLEGNQPTVGEIISAALFPVDPKVTPSLGKADLDGEVELHLLYLTPENAPVRITRRFPIREVIEVPDSDETMLGIAMITPLDVGCTVQDDSFGEKRHIELDAQLNVSLALFGKTAATYVKDAYAIPCDSTIETASASIASLAGISQGAFSVSGVFDREDGGEGKLVFGTVCPGDLSVIFDPDRDRYVIEGSAHVNFLFALDREDGDLKDYSFIAKDIPVKGEINAPCASEDFLARQILVRGARLRADDTRLLADFDLTVTLIPASQSEITYVKSIRVSENCEIPVPEGESITLHFKSESETLWDVAKHYRIDESALIASNGITQDPGKTVLII